MSISDIVIAVLPFISLIALWLFFLLERRLPANQRAELNEIIQIVVQAVEQQGSGLPGTDKKMSAIGLAMDLCKEYEIKEPSAYILSHLIESAVWVLKHAPQPPSPQTPEPAILSTGPLPVPPAPTQAPQA